jgi:hypothetical protein
MQGGNGDDNDVVVDDDGFAWFFRIRTANNQPSAISVEKSRKVKLFSLVDGIDEKKLRTSLVFLYLFQHVQRFFSVLPMVGVLFLLRFRLKEKSSKSFRCD